jgi:nucleoside-diphosphate-sugar epimerase
MRAGHDVTGLDTELYDGCTFGVPAAPIPSIRKDVRDVSVSDLRGFDAVIHLAALANDSHGRLNERSTYDINHLGSVRIAQAAKTAGVTRFVFASSCRVYGAADRVLTEDAPLKPVAAFDRSKALVEAELFRLADETFSPTYLRNATTYGVSPSLRTDTIVNQFVGAAYSTGEIVLHRDGTDWRPLIHVEDLSRAYLAVLQAPREAVHNEAFNVGNPTENYQVRDLAAVVTTVVPGVCIRCVDDADPESRSYRIDYGKFSQRVPGFIPRWTVRRGVTELHDTFVRFGLGSQQLAMFSRINRVPEPLETGRVDASLTWRPHELNTVIECESMRLRCADKKDEDIVRKRASL